MKSYKKPILNVEHFTANEFVAACGDENRVYKFVCDAGGGTPGTVYKDSNHNGRLDFGDDPLTGYIIPTYHACNKTHEAPKSDEFLDGFYIANGIGKPIKVKIWTENGTNVHCTENINMDSWIENKS